VEEYVDLAIATGVFLFFVALSVGLCYYSTIAYASSMMPPDVVAVAYRYPLKIPIDYDPSSKTATIGIGLEGVRAVIAVVDTSGAIYQVKLFEERVLPTKVSAGANEWVVALTPSGCGVKTGAAYPSGLVVTTAGVYPLTSAPSLYPRVKVTTLSPSGYTVEPSEFMVVKTSAGLQTMPIDDGYLSKLRLVNSKLIGSSDSYLKDYKGIVMIKEEYSS
jgi:hypothetical protein